MSSFQMEEVGSCDTAVLAQHGGDAEQDGNGTLLVEAVTLEQESYGQGQQDGGAGDHGELGGGVHAAGQQAGGVEANAVAKTDEEHEGKDAL